MGDTIEWIEGLTRGRLMVGPMPQGGDDLEAEIENWQERGVNVVVSLLTIEEILHCGLIREPQYCFEHGIEFLFYPVKDHDVPDSLSATTSFVLKLVQLLENDKSVLIHCRAGIGRSAMLAGCVLACHGIPPAMAFKQIGTARGYSLVPEMEEQFEWTEQFFDALPGHEKL